MGLILGIGLGACADETAPTASTRPAAPSTSLVAGQSLLEPPEWLRVVEFPTSVAPEALHGPLTELLATEAFRVEPDAWVAGPVLPADSPMAALVSSGEPLRRWRAELPVPPDIGLGGFWMTHDGRPLRQATQGEFLWYLARHVFAWDAERQVLVHYGSQPAGPVAYGWRPGRGASLQTWDVTLAGRASPVDAGELVQSVQRDSRRRRALLAPAPTVLERRVDALHAEALELGVGVLDLALGLRGGGLRRVPGGSDGVTFAVELRTDDGEAQRVWSRHVLPGDRWHDARIDLSAWRGRALTLRLVTETGADVHFDLACWSTLRLRGGARGAPERPHVVLIDIDTLRADRLGCYGAERPTSPRLDAWAAERATVFTDMLAAGDWTLPATASLLTGLAVREHEVIEGAVRVTAAMRPLASRLREHGYETWARTDGGMVSAAFGFATGFDEFDARGLGREDAWVGPFDGLLERLAARDAERPLFLFVQSYRVHGPYRDDGRFADPAYDGLLAGRDPTTDEISRLAEQGRLGEADWAHVRALYDAGIARFDEALGPFLDGLDQALDGQPVLVIITSDHGEELGERGRCGHGHSLHDELTRVPLLVAWPDGGRVGREATPVSHLDLLPTVLDAVGLPADADLSGRSARSMPRGSRLRVAQHRHEAHAAWLDGWKWIEGPMGAQGRPREMAALFATDTDADERQDLADTRPDVATRLAERLDAWRRAHGPRDLVGTASGSLDPALVEQLAALGYVEDR